MSDTIGSNNRLKSWAVFMVFSAIALGAHVSSDNEVASKGLVNWITSATAISLGFSFIACLAHFLVPDRFVSQIPEAGMSILLLIFWVAALPIIMDPDNRMAVTRGRDSESENITVILNSNLYFFSWGCFLVNLYIVGSVASSHGVNALEANSRITGEWYGLTAVSLVVMCSAVRFYTGNCKENEAGHDTCRRTDLAIAVGAFGFVLAAIFSCLSTMDRATLPCTLGGSFVVFVVYAFGVGFTTFGEGPASFLGNLYFFTWGGFIISIMLFGECIVRMFFTTHDMGEIESSSPQVETVQSNV